MIDKIFDAVSSFLNLNDRGQEVPDPTPVAIPVGLGRGESMDERIRRIVQHSLSVEAQAQGFETFDEADDFDIEDDPLDPSTPWETDFDQAYVQAVERGVAAKPDITDDRVKELKEKVSRKPKSPQSDPKPPGSGSPE